MVRFPRITHHFPVVSVCKNAKKYLSFNGILNKNQTSKIKAEVDDIRTKFRVDTLLYM